ncbi:hypothetical protein [Telmatospirillum sp.]|uniref:hypothetical protein n=1 Tax=Telmatospirillum sp. TaxID=2079197 RepID=UPI002851F2E4|nr:hypothetical protein [Telmatospirillum sp.]MDR3441358.1 hypothetical protein [Telmatospirillum sp.]
MDMTTVINGLAVIGAGTCLYWAVRWFNALVRHIQPPDEEDAPSDVVSDDRQRQVAHPSQASAAGQIPPQHIAAIAAAVAAIVGTTYRIVHIDESKSGASWSAEGRWRHQTSHNPH